MLIGIAGRAGVGEILVHRLRTEGHQVVEPAAADVILATTPDILSRPDATTVVITATTATPIAAQSEHPANVVGLRFPLPPPAGKTAEVLRTPFSSAESVARAEKLVSMLGMELVQLGATATEAAQRLLFGYLNHAVDLHTQGYASPADIDTAMRLGCGLPIGPLHLLDLIGIDVAHELMSELADRTGDEALRPVPAFDRLIDAGHCGQRTGRGFHSYDDIGEVPAETGEAVIQRVGVIGSGTMARGIAELTARAGYQTVLIGRTEERCGQARAAISGSLLKAVRRGRITAEQQAETLDRLTTSTDPTALGDCKLVVEAVAEDMAVKTAIFATLDNVCGPDTILATTTSSLSVTDCAEATRSPNRVLGLHFFNPAPIMRLVEVSRTEHTDPAAVAIASAFCRGLGKTPVECADRAGFIVNYLLFPYLRRAVDLLERPGTEIAAIDHAVQAGFGFPMGPFTLLDTIGLDISLAIQNRLYDTFHTPDQRPSPILAGLVAAGYLGRKNGLGLTVQATSGP